MEENLAKMSVMITQTREERKKKNESGESFNLNSGNKYTSLTNFLRLMAGFCPCVKLGKALLLSSSA